jgi:hypothetical protein
VPEFRPLDRVDRLLTKDPGRASFGYDPVVVQRREEKRRYGRVHLTPPLRGEIDGIPVEITELSISGVRIRHEMRLVRVKTHRLRFTWEEKSTELKCELVRTTISRLSKEVGEPTLHESGMRITEAQTESAGILRDLVEEYVVRCINEQLANARGIPPLEANLYQFDKGGRYRCCEFENGKWRRTDTSSSAQPPIGFTISAAVDPYHVEMLCRTWEACDEEGRSLTRTFAQLSVSKAEGGPTRTYLP